MLNIPSEDIKDILVADSSVSLTFKTDLFCEHEPEQPDNCVTLYAYESVPPRQNLDVDNKEMYMPRVQVRVRNKSVQNAWQQCEEIRSALHNVHNHTINGAKYLGIFVASGPSFIERDENRRFIYVINFQLNRESIN